MIATQNPITSRFQLPDPDLPPGVDQKTADEVLDHYLANPAIVMADIANVCGLPVRVVGRILDSDYGRSIIDLIERLSDRRAAIFASEARIQAIATTKRLARESPNDETARRAAAALLRFKTYTPSPTPAKAEATKPDKPDGTRPPTTHPTTGPTQPFRQANPAPFTFPLNNPPTTRVPRAACPPVPSTTSLPFTESPTQVPRAARSPEMVPTDVPITDSPARVPRAACPPVMAPAAPTTHSPTPNSSASSPVPPARASPPT